VDLSPQSIGIASQRYPSIQFAAGDFNSMDLSGNYSFIVSADTIAHVDDQSLFIEKVAMLMPRGGLFLLMTQNPFVWNRSSQLRPAPDGQIRNWPTLRTLRRMLRKRFEILHVSSIV